METIRLTLLLSYVVLVTQGEGIRYVNQGENTSQIFTHQQINKTIQMEGGDIFDCIDVNLQPAFNHPSLKDHKIQMEPSSFPIGMDIKSLPLHDVSEAQLPIIECPRGMVPILCNRIMDHIAAQSIDEVISKDQESQAAGIKYWHDDIYGTRAIINVYEPKVKSGSKDLSASGIHIYNGPEAHADAIGAGYSVAPRLGDSFARFHVTWDQGVLNQSCYDHTCPGFVQISHKIGLGGRVRPISVYNGPQYVISISIYKDPKTKNWWLVYGEENAPIGYWPSSLFTYIKDKGDSAFWGGHVSGPTASMNSPQIGSGHFASEGYGKAAFIKDIQVVDGKNKFVNPNENKAHPSSSNLGKFTVDGFDVTKSGMHVYYGGPGDLV